LLYTQLSAFEQDVFAVAELGGPGVFGPFDTDFEVCEVKGGVGVVESHI
jgi:hypothetical protein